MAARRIIRLAVLILLLVWEPGPDPERKPHTPPEGGGAWLDMGLRFDPAHPWTGWRVYVDLHREAPEPALEPKEDPPPAPGPRVELGLGSLARAAGGARYILLRGGLESFRGVGERPGAEGRP